MLERFRNSIAALALIGLTSAGCSEVGHLGGENPIDCNNGPYSATEEYSLEKGQEIVVGLKVTDFDVRNTIKSNGNGEFTIISPVTKNDDLKIEVMPYTRGLTDKKAIVVVETPDAGTITIFSDQSAIFTSRGSIFTVIGQPAQNGDTLLTVTEECDQD